MACTAVGSDQSMHPTPPARAPFLAAADPGITPAGWYTVSDGRVLWWDGHRWVVVPQPGQHLQPTEMVTTVPVRTHHAAHLIATLCTCGLWAPLWAASAIWNSFRKEQHVTRQR